ncbi:MAG: GNAT family N-acetyltransferase [Alphaproteobacteria bacterium]|nr:GNAT family N-acetyltransferase [Alphaproteobacteria bacterium]
MINRAKNLIVVAKRLRPSETTYPTKAEDPSQLFQRSHLIWMLQDPECKAIIGNLLDNVSVDGIAKGHFGEIPVMPNDPDLKQKLIELSYNLSLYSNPEAMKLYLDGKPRNTVDALLRVTGFFGPFAENRTWVKNYGPRAGFMLYKDGKFVGYTYLTSLDDTPARGIFLTIIHPSYQNQGIGSLVAEFMMETYVREVIEQNRPVYEVQTLKEIKINAHPDNVRWINMLKNINSQ